MNIKVFYDSIKFRLIDSKRIKKLLERVIRDQKMIPGDLNFVFMDDEKLLEINKKYLNHDYFTDVISFDYSEGNIINGEVYISVNTVKNNAKFYSVKFHDEILRVMIHGTLHICGYNDGTIEERENMNQIQDKYLLEYNEMY